jgi:hypothetical protein
MLYQIILQFEVFRTALNNNIKADILAAKKVNAFSTYVSHSDLGMSKQSKMNTNLIDISDIHSFIRITIKINRTVPSFHNHIVEDHTGADNVCQILLEPASQRCCRTWNCWTSTAKAHSMSFLVDSCHLQTLSSKLGSIGSV